MVQTRRDQVQAYRFAQMRMQASLLSGETDRLEPPMRRAGISTFAGVMVSILILAGAGVLAVLNPSGKKGWDAAGVIVVEKETGARFVYSRTDQVLHPVLNYTSARLLLDQPKVTVRQFSRASLADVPRGEPRGWAGLPDSLPPVKGLTKGPWVVCSGTPSGSSVPALRVDVGRAATGQRLGQNDSMLVQTPSGAHYLIWRDTALRITNPPVIQAALRFNLLSALTVSETWINAVTPGPDLESPARALRVITNASIGIGAAAPYTLGATPVYVGQVFRLPAASGVADSYYLAMPDGIMLVPTTIALILLAEKGLLDKAYYNGEKPPEPLTANTADVSGARKSAYATSRAVEFPLIGLPDEVPRLVRPAVDGATGTFASSACTAYGGTSGTSSTSPVYLGPGLPSPSGVRAGSAVPEPVVVGLQPGAAALVRPQPFPGVKTASTFLVTDAGLKFPIPGEAELKALGYADVTPVPLPSQIASLIPNGPPLSSSTAAPAAASGG